MSRRCFFIGHADTPEDIFPGLDTAIEEQIVHNSVTEFYFGNHGRFDVLVYRALRVAKRRYPHIRCYLVPAYHPDDVQIDPPAGMDGIYCPHMESGSAHQAISRTNRAMMEQCDVLIAAVNRPGQEREALRYAQRIEKMEQIRIVNLMTE